MAEIELRDVVKRFGKVMAVDRMNLTVKDKEFLALVGPSGCGKTTTLRMIAGIEELTGGDIYIGDRKERLQKHGLRSAVTKIFKRRNRCTGKRRSPNSGN